MQSYEDVWRTFISEFKRKSEDYVNLLKGQENNVTEIIWRMHSMITKLKEEYETQLIEVEKALMESVCNTLFFCFFPFFV